MKYLFTLYMAVLLCGSGLQAQSARVNDSVSLVKATAALRDAFARKDIAAIVALHHPGIVKYFGGTNVVKGREELAKGLTAMFKTSRMEFIDNIVESTVFTGTAAIETSIFTVRVGPDGGTGTVSRGRSMVIYVRDSSSPTGWLSLREMVQAAPEPAAKK